MYPPENLWLLHLQTLLGAVESMSGHKVFYGLVSKLRSRGVIRGYLSLNSRPFWLQLGTVAMPTQSYFHSVQQFLGVRCFVRPSPLLYCSHSCTYLLLVSHSLLFDSIKINANFLLAMVLPIRLKVKGPLIPCHLTTLVFYNYHITQHRLQFAAQKLSWKIPKLLYFAI